MTLLENTSKQSKTTRAGCNYNRSSGMSSSRLAVGSLLAEHEVNHPVAADVRPVTAAVAQDGFVVAAGVLQRVRETRHRGAVTRRAVRPRRVPPSGDRAVQLELRGGEDWTGEFATDPTAHTRHAHPD